MGTVAHSLASNSAAATRVPVIGRDLVVYFVICNRKGKKGRGEMEEESTTRVEGTCRQTNKYTSHRRKEKKKPTPLKASHRNRRRKSTERIVVVVFSAPGYTKRTFSQRRDGRTMKVKPGILTLNTAVYPLCTSLHSAF